MSISHKRPDVALLIAAHGERREGATNEGVKAIARALAARGVAAEVAVGFMKGEPGIAEAFAALTAPNVVVYPLFAANGYFTRDRLAQLLDEVQDEGRNIEVLPPLGLDPGLPDLVVAHAAHAARTHGVAPAVATLILLAHGSRRNPASRAATTQLARDLAERGTFGTVEIALLEEHPFLDETAARVTGSAVVVGLFSGQGMHGAGDAPRLVAALERPDTIFAGIIGSLPGIEDVIAAAVAQACEGSTLCEREAWAAI